MIKICPIHYQIDGQELMSFYQQNTEKVHLTMENAFAYCDEKQISIFYNPMYAYIEDGEIRIFLNHTLIYRNDIAEDFSPTSFTPAFLSNYNNQEIEELERTVLKIITTGFVIAYNIETRKYKCKKKKSTFYEIYELKNTPISMKRFENGTNVFTVKPDKEKVTFVTNYMKREKESIPNEHYPMPNSNSIRFFYNKNTKDVDDIEKLDEVMSFVPEELGKCYSISEKIIESANKIGYSKVHKVEFYSGWMKYIYADKIAHHAWVVIDNCSVIDMTLKKTGKIIDYLEKIENGYASLFNREELAKWVHEEKTENALFSKYHFCGKVENAIYIGTQCTRKEAIQSFRTALSKGLPDYESAKNGGYENKLQKLYSEKYGNDI